MQKAYIAIHSPASGWALVFKIGLTIFCISHCREPNSQPHLLITVFIHDNISSHIIWYSSCRSAESTSSDFVFIESLKSNKTWVLTDLSKGRKVVKEHWVYKIKRDGHYKACWVAKRFEQQPGINFNETYALVVRAVRPLFALAAIHNWEIKQMDVKTAFLHRNIEEKVYVEQPHGYNDDNTQVCSLKKALYGLKQSPRAWYHTLWIFLESLEFTTVQADQAVFINKTSQIIITSYVNDLLLFEKMNR